MSRRIKPTRSRPPLDAFEREFGADDGTEPEQPLKPYCGAKRPVPRGKTLAQPHYCFKAGLKSGFKAGLEKGEEAGRKKQATRGRIGTEVVSSRVRSEEQKKADARLKAEQKKTEAKLRLEKVLTKREIGEIIDRRGLSYLKRYLHVGNLNIGELKGLQSKMPYGSPDKHTHYGRLSLDGLRQWLVNHGWKP